MIDFIFCVATNAFRTYLIGRFIRVFAGEKKINKTREVLSYLGFFIVTTSLYLGFHIAWINIISNILGIAFLVQMYRNSWKFIFFATSSIYLINIGCDAVSVLPFANYQDGQRVSQIFSVITVFLIFICEIVTEKIVNDRRKTETVEKIPLLVVPICSVMILVLLMIMTIVSDVSIMIVSVGLLIINFFLFQLYNMLLRSISDQYEKELLE